MYLFLYFFLQDRDGTLRVTGEEWLVKKTGAYLPGAYEEVVDTVGAYVLNDKVRTQGCLRTIGNNMFI